MSKRKWIFSKNSISPSPAVPFKLNQNNYSISQCRYCDGLAKYGHENFERIAEDLPGKSLDDVMKYHKTFWARGRTEVKSFDTFIYMIKRQENRKKREEENKIKQKAILKAFEWKMRNTPNPRVEISVKQTQSQLFTKEQDTFILNSVYKHGITNPDTYHLIRREVLYVLSFSVFSQTH